MSRRITDGEDKMLRRIFREMLPYDRLTVEVNKRDLGGKANSITPSGVTYMSQLIYVDDFSKAPLDAQWTFVHEHVHVWQYVHGALVALDAVGLWIWNVGSYANAYSYKLDPETSFKNLNIEQQASCVADYFFVEKGLQSKDNIGSNAGLEIYKAALSDFWSAGPPRKSIAQPPPAKSWLRSGQIPPMSF